MPLWHRRSTPSPDLVQSGHAFGFGSEGNFMYTRIRRHPGILFQAGFRRRNHQRPFRWIPFNIPGSPIESAASDQSGIRGQGRGQSAFAVSPSGGADASSAI